MIYSERPDKKKTVSGDYLQTFNGNQPYNIYMPEFEFIKINTTSGGNVDFSWFGEGEMSLWFEKETGHV